MFCLMGKLDRAGVRPVLQRQTVKATALQGFGFQIVMEDTSASIPTAMCRNPIVARFHGRIKLCEASDVDFPLQPRSMTKPTPQTRPKASWHTARCAQQGSVAKQPEHATTEKVLPGCLGPLYLQVQHGLGRAVTEGRLQATWLVLLTDLVKNPYQGQGSGSHGLIGNQLRHCLQQHLDSPLPCLAQESAELSGTSGEPEASLGGTKTEGAEGSSNLISTMILLRSPQPAKLTLLASGCTTFTAGSVTVLSSCSGRP